jgi:hypothetical protein
MHTMPRVDKVLGKSQVRMLVRTWVLCQIRVVCRSSKGYEMSSKTTQFESLLEAVPDALVGIDQKGVIRFVNGLTESLFGYDRDDLVGQTIETLLPDPLWQIYAAHREEHFADPRMPSGGVDLVLSGRQRDGTEFPVSITLSSIDSGDVLLVVTAVRDVTTPKAQVEVSQLTAAIIQYSSDAIIGCTPDGVVTSWNPAAEQMFGYSSKEIIGRSATLLTPEDQSGELFANLARVKEGKAVEHFETMRVRKDETMFPVSLTVAPIRDTDGAIVGICSIARDIAADRDIAAEQEAVASDRRMAAIEFSGEAIISTTLEGIITSWNPAAERLYGYSGEEVIGQSGTLLAPEDRAGEVSGIMARIRAGEAVKNFETKRVRKDGTTFPISLTISPIRDSAGAIVGASSTPRDITRQKEAFEAAKQMAALVENSADAIISQTLEGIITTWNPAAESLYGHSSEEIIGKPVELLSPKGRTGEITSILARIRAGRPVEHHETMRVRKDGTPVRVSLTVSPIRGADGTIVGACVIHRDLAG